MLDKMILFMMLSRRKGL